MAESALALILGLGIAFTSWISGVAPGMWRRGGLGLRSDGPGLFRFIIATYALTGIIVSLIIGLANYAHQ